MSDIEDEMDVDVPNKSMVFSMDGNAGKQKRVVADLPVGVGDNLPWYNTETTSFFTIMILTSQG